jgi:hypothetical protein
MLVGRVKTLESEMRIAELLKLEDDHIKGETVRKLDERMTQERQLLQANAAMWRKALDDIKEAGASKDEQLEARMNCLEGELAHQKRESQYYEQTLITVCVFLLTLPA